MTWTITVTCADANLGRCLQLLQTNKDAFLNIGSPLLSGREQPMTGKVKPMNAQRRQRGRPRNPTVQTGNIMPTMSPIVWDRGKLKQAVQEGQQPSVLFLQELQSQGAAQFKRRNFDEFLKAIGRKPGVASYHISNLVKTRAIRKIGGKNRAQTYYELESNWPTRVNNIHQDQSA